MTIHKAKWLLVGLVWLAFWAVDAPAQGNEWESYRDVGVEKQFATAVRAAEEFGPEDLRASRRASTAWRRSFGPRANSLRLSCFTSGRLRSRTASLHTPVVGKAT